MIRRIAIATLLAAVAGAAWSQSYPNKPVRLVVPYPPGGPTDIVARVVAERLGAQTGQTFVVDNKAGAGGNLGAEAVARSAPDGYTLLVATTAHAINMTVFKQLAYDVKRDFAPVSLLTQGPLVLVTHPGFGAATVADVIAKARAQSGGLPYASSGNGQSTHLSAELFASMAGVKLVHVPYKGSAPALQDVIGGQVPMMFDTMLSAMPHVKSGALKAVAITGERRSPAAPELPTIAESGLGGYQAYAWNGLLAPAGTPPEVINRLSEELKKALALPAVQERFAAQGFAASWTAPAATVAYVAAEVDKWREVAQRSGAKVD
ncbi:MAG TPA: tripartite tricarboxylate transporter substrate binding protein [Burkholderiaceae bacterium]|nr:tripartite tricarboxylate transporter substrate binding protein [Burkholderiaceae bacterium]